MARIASMMTGNAPVQLGTLSPVEEAWEIERTSTEAEFRALLGDGSGTIPEPPRIEVRHR